MRITARATTVALLPALLFAAVGCGSTDTPATGKAPAPSGSAASGAPGTGTSAGTSAGAASGAPAAPKTGGTKLERASLEQGDLPGYQISSQANPNAPHGQPQADKKACQPLADAMGDKPDPAARESVNRGIGSQRQVGLAVAATVSSYSESDAKRLVSRLRQAIAACGGGFSATIEKQTGSYKDVKAASYKTGGDESVSWTTTAVAGDASAQVHLVVVRQGGTVVRLTALNVAAAGQKAQVPQEVADKQLEKVKRAG
ncbi:hypothetical protein OHU17_14200 [Streptomyces goshikiensis]|uniref:Lipoprotein n=1 Tax=Streptomyces goshikiensis TaxID=1942 RepID=A0ABZ1RK76_9ACTN|nr:MULTISPECIES: hypothetical protein [Streptomyces]AKL67553.1 hypothetical protein M444_21530 [Streptomyces sp. Mg1]EDX25019.1 lipoprotein [Streptomyces sp. Mg1]PJN18055.1 hypothetical protein CG724_15955 [Streptomyces sp. CB02120-2]RPK46733.1 hypothetical protein EES37_12160 [Streptomyces sp. ADI91-18]WBY21748.1 hypothetical protein PET44_20270 [Streptomyces goshikiensis]